MMDAQFDLRRFGRWLSALHERRGLTQAELAEQVGVEVTTVGRWMRGATAPKLANLGPLGRALGVSVDELVSGTEAKGGIPVSIAYRDKPILSLMRPPRDSKERLGLEIAERQFGGEAPEESRERLGLSREAYLESLMRICNNVLRAQEEHVPIDRDLSDRLCERYQLRRCLVASLGSVDYLLKTVLLGALGARVVVDLFEQSKVRLSVGFAGGPSCGRVVTALIQSERLPGLELDVMPIAVRSMSGAVEADANVLVGMLGFFSRYTGVNVLGLPYVSNAQLDCEPDQHAATRAVLDRARQVNVAFLGLGADLNYFFDEDARRPGAGLMGGATSPFELKQRGCIGDVLYTLVTPDGPMDAFRADCDRIVCSVGLEALQRMAVGYSVVSAVAAGKHKAGVLRLALEKRYINSAIADSELAQAVLQST